MHYLEIVVSPFLTLYLLSDLYLSVDSQAYRALGCSDACYSCGSSRHSTSGCQEKQTPVPCPSLGPGQRFVIRGVKVCLAFVPFHLGVSPSFISRGRA